MLRPKARWQFCEGTGGETEMFPKKQASKRCI